MVNLKIKEIRERCFKIFEQETFVQRAFLFGSYARGEETSTSDLDFIVEINKDVGLEFFGLYDYLQEEFKKPVDVITLEESYKIMGNKPDEQKILIYERLFEEK